MAFQQSEGVSWGRCSQGPSDVCVGAPQQIGFQPQALACAVAFSPGAVPFAPSSQVFQLALSRVPSSATQGLSLVFRYPPVQVQPFDSASVLQLETASFPDRWRPRDLEGTHC